ncbi:hypothetical protein K7G68_03185 [Micrococcus luteus]|uniref:hypothetical protein n=1 Tax=Micrococcus luteus TaxID=1270 RepID=UPI001CA7A975|nr:hypothetical protein [Micrococcus luteus]QZY84670.1 hypothetical protein K7G68_03185 [Micrococcus luteus]
MATVTGRVHCAGNAEFTMIDAWDSRMSDAFDYRHHGEGLEPERWPAAVREALTREYAELLTELQGMGLPVVGDTWWQ